jgi:hypothetical protein
MKEAARAKKQKSQLEKYNKNETKTEKAEGRKAAGSDLRIRRAENV